MAVAAAQLAIADAGFAEKPMEPESTGVVLGSDYMLTMPEDYSQGMKTCAPEGQFQFTKWGKEGLGDMAPLWMLKYLPNMPASHIAIYNDLRGPNNSLTMREAAGNLAVGEAFRTIQRGHANMMVAGATGTRILPMQAIHALQTEQMAAENGDPAKASKPFDKQRTGMVAGEGAGMVVLEEYESAKARGATIYAEVLGLGSANVADATLHGKCDTALERAMKSALRDAGTTPNDVGHINAHGLSTTDRDADEARAIQAVFGAQSGTVPVTALKSYFGNLGAGSGVVELIASVLALRDGKLPRVLNYKTPDPACALPIAADDGKSSGRSFLNLSVTPQGQAAVLYIAACG
jgi:3-oxoacyl-[acyl-carrier-protein] synthase II